MKFGIHTQPTQKTVDVRQLGQHVEALGFESLFFPDHTYLPAGFENPRNPGWAARGSSMFDPLIALTMVAAVTTTLKVGTGVALVPLRDPIILAKEVASIDVLSEGRMLFGVGAGWALAIIAFAAIRERLRYSDVPDGLRGLGLAFIVTGLMSMAFSGFAGVEF